MIPLKQSTAFTWKAGPFVDDTDGKTPETALSIAQADIRLAKAGGDYAQSHNAAGATHDEYGCYDVPLDATDTNTVGHLRVTIQKSGALPVWQDFFVKPANVYDAECGSDLLDVNVSKINEASQTAGDVAALITALDIPADPPSAADIADAVLDEAAAGHTGVIATNLDAAISSRSTFAGGAVASVTAGVTVATNADKTGYSLSVTPPTKEEISTKVWGETVRALTDKAGFSLSTAPPTAEEIDAALSDAHGSGDWGASGTGSSSLDITVTSSGEPIEGIMVEVYSSAVKTGFIRKTTTNGSGLAHFDINPGTYYVWVLHSDYTGTNPTEVIVT